VKEYTTSQIRNVALIGHSGTGKTMITESLLFMNKMIERMGSTDSGNTQSDYDSEEVKRKTSINTSLFPIETGGMKINLFDCPGYRDFIGEIQCAVRMADLAIVTVDSITGAEPGTEFAWDLAEEYQIPRAVFVNKMDKERADFDKALDALRAVFPANIVALTLPIGKESSFEGVVDLVKMKACRDKGGKPHWSDIPAELAEAAAAARAQLIEAAAEGDDAITEKFLMEEPLTDEEIVRGLRGAILNGRCVPALCGAAPSQIGLTVLQDFILTLAPLPDQRPGLTASIEGKEEKETISIASDKPLVVFVFKTVNDDYAGRLSFFKVLNGTLTSETAVLNTNSGRQERIAHTLIVTGKKNMNIHQIHAGDIGAVSKLDSTRTNDTLVDVKGRPVKVEPTVLPSQTVFMMVVPKSKGDEDKVGMGIHRLIEADPSLRIERDSALHQTILSGMGETHLDVAVSRLRNVSHVEVDLLEPKIPYRETLSRTAKGQGRHKKQTGGRGQFGDCWIRLEPRPRGAGFEFAWEIVGGVIPSNYQKAVEKGLVEALARGIQAGYPVVDVKAACYDGSYHAVDSSDLSFQLAAIKAFKTVSREANPIILEPIVNVKVIVPDQYMGDVMGSLSGKRGRILGSNTHGRKAVIEAQVPQAEMASYSRELRSMTQGRGTFEMAFSHYDPTPPHVQEQIIAASEKQKEEDED
jgi:elongation factor G